MKKNRMIIMIFLVLGIILNENIVTFAKDDETNVRYVVSAQYSNARF